MSEFSNDFLNWYSKSSWEKINKSFDLKWLKSDINSKTKAELNKFSEYISLLKSDKLDLNSDWIENKEDFILFLKKIISITKNNIRLEAESFFLKDQNFDYSLVWDIEKIVDEVSNVEEDLLSKIILNEILIKLWEIIGYNITLKKDQNWEMTDDYWKNSYSQNLVLSKIASWNYSDFYSKVYDKKYIDNISKLEIEYKKQIIDKYKVNSENIDKIKKLLIEYWWSLDEYLSENSSNWPTIIFFPEMHNAEKLLKDHANIIYWIQENIDYVFTEGFSYWMLTPDSRDYLNTDDVFDKIWWRIWNSPYALLLLVNNSINILWVENDDFSNIVKILMLNWFINNNKLNLKTTSDIMEFYKENNIKTIKDLFNYSYNQKGSNFVENVVISYRNQIWLDNILKIYSQRNLNTEKWISIISWGWAHVKDFTSRANLLWFNVIVYNSKYLSENISQKTLNNYFN